MIQNLIVQPSSPLCSPKPVVVQDFQLDALMGQWYQVNYYFKNKLKNKYINYYY